MDRSEPHGVRDGSDQASVPRPVHQERTQRAVAPDALADDAGRQQPPERRNQGTRQADVTGRPGLVPGVLETGGGHPERSQHRRLHVLLDALAGHSRDHLGDQQIPDVGVRRS
jgi:hypothetical protein